MEMITRTRILILTDAGETLNNTLLSVLFLKMRIDDVWCLNIICCLSVVGGQMEAGVDQTFLLLKLFSAPSIVDVSDSVNDRIS